jgi:hypothetical protein
MLIKYKYCVSFLSLMTFIFVTGEYYVDEYITSGKPSLKCYDNITLHPTHKR